MQSSKTRDIPSKMPNIANFQSPTFYEQSHIFFALILRKHPGVGAGRGCFGKCCKNCDCANVTIIFPGICNTVLCNVYWLHKNSRIWMLHIK